ncbi:MAG: hypothetical protein HKN17_10690, partial [Rhodothermales bacterium]|nr:hypothetical protein [Rhodothermales bacterium]
MSTGTSDIGKNGSARENSPRKRDALMDSLFDEVFEEFDSLSIDELTDMLSGDGGTNAAADGRRPQEQEPIPGELPDYTFDDAGSASDDFGDATDYAFDDAAPASDNFDDPTDYTFDDAGSASDNFDDPTDYAFDDAAPAS